MIKKIMYKKFGTILILCNMTILIACFNVKGIQASRLASTPAFQLKFSQDFWLSQVDEADGTSFMKLLKRASSGQRVISCSVLEKKRVIDLAEADYDALLRIVESEAGCEDEYGKMLVANVVLNRVKSEKFPNSVKEVVMQRENGVTQFSPVSNGRFHTVEVSEETILAVEKVLEGNDNSQGALYFAARKYADPDRMKWFDTHLTRLFTYGGHEFFG